MKIHPEFSARELGPELVKASNEIPLDLFEEIWCDILWRSALSALPSVGVILNTSVDPFVLEKCADLAGAIGLGAGVMYRKQISVALAKCLRNWSPQSPGHSDIGLINVMESLIELTGREHMQLALEKSKFLSAFGSELLESIGGTSPAIRDLVSERDRTSSAAES